MLLVAKTHKFLYVTFTDVALWCFSLNSNLAHSYDLDSLIMFMFMRKNGLKKLLRSMPGERSPGNSRGINLMLEIHLRIKVKYHDHYTNNVILLILIYYTFTYICVHKFVRSSSLAPYLSCRSPAWCEPTSWGRRCASWSRRPPRRAAHSSPRRPRHCPPSPQRDEARST